MSKNLIEMYANFISKQNRGVLKEAADDHKAVEKAVSNKEKIGVGHLASHGTHHVLSPYDSSTHEDEMHYIHHDTATGKNHHFSLASKKHSVASVHKAMNKAVPGGVHKDLAKKVANAHNEDFDHDD